MLFRSAQQGAGQLPEGVWGWAGLPVEEAEKRMQTLLEARNAGARFMPDFRPHSHHYSLMAQIRVHPMEVGHTLVNGQLVFGGMTSWGDGLFPVLLLKDAGGQLAGIRIVLSGESGPEAEGIGLPLGVGPGMPGLPPTPGEATQIGRAHV